MSIFFAFWDALPFPLPFFLHLNPPFISNGFLCVIPFFLGLPLLLLTFSYLTIPEHNVDCELALSDANSNSILNKSPVFNDPSVHTSELPDLRLKSLNKFSWSLTDDSTKSSILPLKALSSLLATLTKALFAYSFSPVESQTYPFLSHPALLQPHENPPNQSP